MKKCMKHMKRFEGIDFDNIDDEEEVEGYDPRAFQPNTVTILREPLVDLRYLHDKGYIWMSNTPLFLENGNPSNPTEGFLNKEYKYLGVSVTIHGLRIQYVINDSLEYIMDNNSNREVIVL